MTVLVWVDRVEEIQKLNGPAHIGFWVSLVLTMSTRRDGNATPKLNKRCSQYFSLTKLPSSRSEY